jgi:peptidoglycan biosynthesis protein MviN/MurJ (putative lipid II flippase)
MMVGIVVFNLVGNLVLVPLLHLEGSATATALALVFSAGLLAAMVKKQVGVRL